MNNLSYNLKYILFFASSLLLCQAVTFGGIESHSYQYGDQKVDISISSISNNNVVCTNDQTQARSLFHIVGQKRIAVALLLKDIAIKENIPLSSVDITKPSYLEVEFMDGKCVRLPITDNAKGNDNFSIERIKEKFIIAITLLKETMDKNLVSVEFEEKSNLLKQDNKYFVYSAKEGERIKNIADAFGIPSSKIREYNNFKDDVISTNRKIKIPVGGTSVHLFNKEFESSLNP